MDRSPYCLREASFDPQSTYMNSSRETSMFQATSSTHPNPNPDSPVPGRTSKACCSCRRDKIKCDGGRPCAACIKKGLPIEKCVDGCSQCRRYRMRCDGGVPCAQCAERGLKCTDEPPSPSISPDEAPKRLIATRSMQHGRAKLACQSCRRDNKKCDERRPCGRCVTRHEECVHVERNPKLVRHRCINCRTDNKKCEDTRPCQFCVETGYDCIDAPRKGLGSGTRVRTACVNCRRYKVQCDSERPCHYCMRRGLECRNPTCTCRESGRELGTCTVCRAQKSKGGSQPAAEPASQEAIDEGEDDLSDTPSSNTPSMLGFGEDIIAQSSLPFGTRLSPLNQEHMSYGPPTRYYNTDFQPNEAFGGMSNMSNMAQYNQQHPALSYEQARQPAFEELSPSADSYRYNVRMDGRQHQQGQYPHRINSPRSMLRCLDDTQGRENEMQGMSIGGAGELDRNVVSNLTMGTPARSNIASESSARVDYMHGYPLFPPYQQAPTTPRYHTEGVDDGVGTYIPDGQHDYGLLSGPGYGPTPTATPASLNLEPVTTSRQSNETAQSGTGQIGMHTALGGSTSAYYLSSDPRPTRDAPPGSKA